MIVIHFPVTAVSISRRALFKLKQIRHNCMIESQMRSQATNPEQQLTKESIVIALGGNALLRRGQKLDAETQRKNAQAAAASIAQVHSLFTNKILLVHGNGPQVGLLALNDPETSLDVLDAESEGEIGFILELALGNALPLKQQTVAMLTQIEVDPSDPAFKHPTKPIGRWYDDDSIGKEKGWEMTKDGDNKYRRVVASPAPRRIIEANAIKLLLEAGVLVISCGGGGIPVAVDSKTGKRVGIEAVIDKDAASALLAETVGASLLLILTDEDCIYDPKVWPKEKRPLPSPCKSSALKTMKFPAGSMAPKVQAAIDFVERTGGKACIGNMERAIDIIQGKSGTSIVKG